MNRKSIGLIITPVIFVLCCIFVFTGLGAKGLDLIIKQKKGIVESDKVVLVNIDDASMESAGTEQWTRDIYAETVLVLKELGNSSTVIDVDFSAQSPFNYFFNYDDFFANTMKVCNNVAIPFFVYNNYSADNFSSKKNSEYIKSNYSIENFIKEKIEVENDTVTPVYDLIWACNPTLEKAPAVMGFDNVIFDGDGRVRKIRLLAKTGDKYFGNIVFSALLKELNVKKLKVSNSKIILETEGTEESPANRIVLPRTETGDVILNFPQKNFSEYNSLSLWSIYHIKQLENVLADTVMNMEEDGFFDYTPDFHSPYKYCVDFIRFKEMLFAEELKFDEYAKAKSLFYESIKMYLESAAQELLLEDADGREKKISFINNGFEQLRKQYEEISELRTMVEAKVKNAVCIISNTSSVTGNFYKTLYQDRYPGAGIYYVLANMLMTENKFIMTLPWWIFIAIVFALCAAAEFLIFKFVKADKVNTVQGKRAVAVAAKTGEMTVLVSDLKDFGQIEEKQGEENSILILNEYHKLMTDIIEKNNGAVVKHDADGIFAVFENGEKENHAVDACRAAVQMKKAEAEYNQHHSQTPHPVEFFTRIGINTGEVTTCSVGPEGCQTYSMLGKAVTVAAELEEENREFKTGGILISETTLKAITNKFSVRALDKVKVKGVKNPMRVFEVFDETDTTDDKMWALIEKWQQALSLFDSGDYAQAKKLFDSVHRARKTDETAKIYSARCTEELNKKKDE